MTKFGAQLVQTRLNFPLGLNCGSYSIADIASNFGGIGPREFQFLPPFTDIGQGGFDEDHLTYWGGPGQLDRIEAMLNEDPAVFQKV